MNTSNPNPTPTDREPEARTRILDAALTEFSEHGLAGARTETIAASAGVNKALLYYYFESKEKLYAAAFEAAAERVRDSSLAALDSGASPGHRLLQIALNHFDRILTQREFQSLMQQEMIRRHQGEPGNLPVLVERIFKPLYQRFEALVTEGIASGELIDADFMQMHLVALGANVFYFLSAPFLRLMAKPDSPDPFAPQALAARRKLLVEFLGQAVFQDRQHGAAIAAKVLANSPMPALPEKFWFGRQDERTK
jgi:TetR/AcrR family transcriptional regulator